MDKRYQTGPLYSRDAFVSVLESNPDWIGLQKRIRDSEKETQETLREEPKGCPHCRENYF